MYGDCLALDAHFSSLFKGLINFNIWISNMRTNLFPAY